jgi:hypothetical protein
VKSHPYTPSAKARLLVVTLSAGIYWAACSRMTVHRGGVPLVWSQHCQAGHSAQQVLRRHNGFACLSVFQVLHPCRGRHQRPRG